jgi:hypothetical protein
LIVVGVGVGISGRRMRMSGSGGHGGSDGESMDSRPSLLWDGDWLWWLRIASKGLGNSTESVGVRVGRDETMILRGRPEIELKWLLEVLTAGEFFALENAPSITCSLTDDNEDELDIERARLCCSPFSGEFCIVSTMSILSILLPLSVVEFTALALPLTSVLSRW